MKDIDAGSLTSFDGKEGRPAYVAYRGSVYDVTASPRWKEGLHMRRHQAGQDLTAPLQAAPHGPEMLDRYPQVGVLRQEGEPERAIPGPLAQLLARFPFLRRHPHPMTVHFPIVFATSAVGFTLLYLITGVSSFGTSAFHCLAAGALFTPVAVATGFYTWWLNYLAKPLRPVTIKRRLALPLWLAFAAAFLWHLAAADPLHPFGLAGALYLALVVSLVPLAAVLGWLGAQLTFPVERRG